MEESIGENVRRPATSWRDTISEVDFRKKNGIDDALDKPTTAPTPEKLLAKLKNMWSTLR